MNVQKETLRIKNGDIDLSIDLNLVRHVVSHFLLHADVKYKTALDVFGCVDLIRDLDKAYEHQLNSFDKEAIKLVVEDAEKYADNMLGKDHD